MLMNYYLLTYTVCIMLGIHVLFRVEYIIY